MSGIFTDSVHKMVSVFDFLQLFLLSFRTNTKQSKTDGRTDRQIDVVLYEAELSVDGPNTKPDAELLQRYEVSQFHHLFHLTRPLMRNYREYHDSIDHSATVATRWYKTLQSYCVALCTDDAKPQT